MKGAEQRGGIGMCEEKCEGKEKGKGKESREVRGAWRGMSVEGEERREKEEERRSTSVKGIWCCEKQTSAKEAA